MRQILIATLGVLALNIVPPLAMAQPAKVRLFILSGQSNMAAFDPNVTGAEGSPTS